MFLTHFVLARWHNSYLGCVIGKIFFLFLSLFLSVCVCWAIKKVKNVLLSIVLRKSESVCVCGDLLHLLLISVKQPTDDEEAILSFIFLLLDEEFNVFLHILVLLSHTHSTGFRQLARKEEILECLGAFQNLRSSNIVRDPFLLNEWVRV